MKPIIWTRSIEDWSKDRLLFGDNIDQITHLPCLSTKPLDFEFTHADHIIFTSPKGVHYSLQNAPFATAIRSAKIYCFGEKTAHALFHRGYQPKQITAAGAQAFAENLTTLIPKEEHILIIRPKHAAYDIDAYLRSAGFLANSAIAYETTHQATTASGTILGKHQINKIENTASVVCLASPSAYHGFKNCFTDRNKPIFNLAVCIGETTANQAKEFFKQVQVCANHTSESLFQTAFSLSSQN